MPKVCEICGKGTMSGNRIVRHGLAKSKGGIGLHTTGITKRKFEPNLHRIHVRVNGTARRMTVCASCIKKTTITKA
ncbi:MAG: 50S ribosomal protein L28 [Lentisphaerae bacterium]|nr:50S ribosomal protein L28 [Lentisphaerota bacterium]